MISKTKLGRWVLLGFALSLCACATTSKSKTTAKGATNEPQNVAETIRQDKVEGTKIQKSPVGDLVINGIKLQNTQFDIPIAINSRVEHWVDYFLGRGRVHFEKYLERAEFFVPYIKPLLKENGLPEDLVYLAMIESGFNKHARSRAKAVGPWQFMSATGKRYGLMVNWWVDERRDTRKSTLAAVEYLRDLYQIFGHWELAAAAYNSGEAKIARAIQRFGSKDFWVLSRQRYLRQETRDYVPKIIAAALLSKNRTLFGFQPPGAKPAVDEVIAGDGEVVKVEKKGEAPAINPVQAANAGVAQDAIAKIIKEAEASEAAKDSEDDSEDAPQLVPSSVVVRADLDRQAKSVPTPHISKKGELSGMELVEIEVPSPADLLRVADAAGLSYQTMKSLNPDVLRWCTPPTVSSYRIKIPMAAKDKFLENYNSAKFPRKVDFLTYKVKSGDTLSRIARHFGIKVDPMTDLNGVSPKVPLRNGTRILLPIPYDKSRSLASLEVRDPPDRRRRRSSRGNYRVNFKKRQSAQSKPVT